MKKLNVNIPQILSDISEKSDKLINEEARAPPKEEEWFEKIREIVDQIASGTYENKENDEDTEGILEFSAYSIPACLHFIDGGIVKEATRVSAAFPTQNRHHLHKQSLNRKKSLVKARSSGRVSNQASQRNSRSSRNTTVAETSQSAGQEEVQHTPMDRTFVKNDSPTPSSLTPLVKRKSSKMTLEKELFHKKLKVATSHVASEPPHLVVRTSRFSGGKKLSSLSEANKLSTFGPRISAKKSALEAKTVVKATSCKEGSVSENLKKIKDAQSKMIEEKKRLREEKMERIKEKRMKLEIAKAENVKQKIKETDSRSSRAIERSESKRTRSRDPNVSASSKSAVKAAAASPKKRPGRWGSKKIKIESPDESSSPDSSTKKTPGPLVNKTITKFESSKVSETPTKGKSTLSSKTPKVSETPAKSKRPKTPSKTSKETPAKGKKLTSASETPAKRKKLTSASETPAKGKRPTPPYKTPNPKVTPAPEKKPPVAETPASAKSLESQSSSKRRATPPIKSQPLKVTPTIVKLTATGHATVVKDASKKPSVKRLPSSPPSAKGSMNASKKLKSENSVSKGETPAKTVKGKTKPESYDMTPDRSSFTSYDMSEIVSDDDEDTPANQKPIPSWAVGLRLRNALIQQYYNPPKLDELFGTYLESPNLEVIFECQKKAYHKRTSSAVWNSPGMFK